MSAASRSPPSGAPRAAATWLRQLLRPGERRLGVDEHHGDPRLAQLLDDVARADRAVGDHQGRAQREHRLGVDGVAAGRDERQVARCRGTSSTRRARPARRRNRGPGWWRRSTRRGRVRARATRHRRRPRDRRSDRATPRWPAAPAPAAGRGARSRRPAARRCSDPRTRAGRRAAAARPGAPGSGRAVVGAVDGGAEQAVRSSAMAASAAIARRSRTRPADGGWRARPR